MTVPTEPPAATTNEATIINDPALTEQLETQVRMAAMDFASRIHHSSVDALVEDAIKVYNYLKGETTDTSLTP